MVVREVDPWVEALAFQPGLAERQMRDHAAVNGRCKVCKSVQPGSRLQWPCYHYLNARDAVAYREARVDAGT